MLINDLLVLIVVVCITLFILNVVFIRLTRLPNHEPESIGCFTSVFRLILFGTAQFFWLSVCAIGILYVVLSRPDNPLVARYPELARERMQAFMHQPVEGPAVIIPMLALFGITLGVIGNISMMPTAMRRWHDKTWDDPGDGISRLLRAVAIGSSNWSFISVELIILIVALVYLKNWLATDNHQLSTLIARLSAPTLSRIEQGVLWLLGAATLFSLLWIIIAVGNAIKEWRRRTWPAVEGVITNTRIRETILRGYSGRSRTTSVHYDFEANYDFTRDGKQYEATQVSITQLRSNYPTAWLLSKRFPIGAHVPVYYDPAHPEQTTLVREVQLYPLVTGLLGAVTLITFACALGIAVL